jgi:hypothetical protein
VFNTFTIAPNYDDRDEDVYAARVDTEKNLLSQSQRQGRSVGAAKRPSKRTEIERSVFHVHLERDVLQYPDSPRLHIKCNVGTSMQSNSTPPWIRTHHTVVMSQNILRDRSIPMEWSRQVRAERPSQNAKVCRSVCGDGWLNGPNDGKLAFPCRSRTPVEKKALTRSAFHRYCWHGE